ncbi:MAG: hypothetical protein K8R53_06780, partial [Bacteroidales bacterium]|nr:hypothetical protein [Bacteroidales bacterium]
MKKAILVTTLAIIFILTNAQNPILHWKFTNECEYGDGEFYYFEFDVEVSCDIAGTYHSKLCLCINYDTVAYGPNAFSNNMVTIQELDLLLGNYQGNPKYDFIIQDFDPDKIKIETQANLIIGSPLFMNEIPVLPNFEPLCKLKFKIKRVSPNGFFQFFQPEMDNHQYYVDASHPTETKYGDPPNYEGVYENDITGLVGSHATWYNLQVFLEGSYDTANHKMRTNLLNNGYVPLNQPYQPILPYYGNIEPKWYYEGNETATAIPPDVVDWLMLEIRDAPTALAATSETTIAKGAFFLES